MKPFRRYFTFTRYFYRLNGLIKEDPFHCHPEYEILYFNNACCDYALGDKIIKLQPGDLLVMNGLSRHWPIKATMEEYTRTSLVFEPNLMQVFHPNFNMTDPLMPFEQLRNVHIRLTGESKLECEDILRRINRFYRKSDEVHYSRFLMAFFDLLLFIRIHSRSAAIEENADPLGSVQKIIDYIENHYTEDITLEQIEAYAHMSRFHLSRTFRKTTGTTIFDYLFSRRINQAKILFYHRKENTVTDVCYQVGFKHVAHFSRMFKKHVGMTPDQYRKHLHPL
jgi:AraC-like DNA-binding protein